MFKKKINILGIKRDTLFTLFFEFAMAILPSIINRSRKAKEEKSELWKVDIKYIDDNTYAFVCLLSFVESSMAMNFLDCYDYDIKRQGDHCYESA